MDFDYNRPIYLQVAEEIKRKIVTGEISPGDKLPSSVDLAMLYKINPNTVQRIYKALETEGVCYTKRGIGTFVTEEESFVTQLREIMENQLIDDFLYGIQTLGIAYEDAVEKMQIRRNENHA